MQDIEITPEIDEALGTASVALLGLVGARGINVRAETEAYDAALSILAALVGSMEIAVEMTEAELI